MQEKYKLSLFLFLIIERGKADNKTQRLKLRLFFTKIEFKLNIVHRVFKGRYIDIDRQIQTDRQTEQQQDRSPDIAKKTERHIDRQTKDRQIENRKTENRQTYRKIDSWGTGQPDRHIDRYTDRQIDR